MPDDLRSLQSRFRSPGITFAEDASGLIHLTLSTRTATVKLYLQGAHLTHYQPAGGAPVLFTSAHSLYQPGKPIRGGVPIVFPWFGPHPTDPKQPAHGWARTSDWTVDDVHAEALSTATASLSLAVEPFSLRYTVRAGASLDMALEVHNAGGVPVPFEEALHTYLAVSDVRQISVEGLDGREYLDKVDGGRRKTQSGPITVTGETDRVYLNTPDTVTVYDPAAGRRIVVSKENSATTVVWNPWVEKARRMSDFGDDEWPGMLCIETANAAENAVILPPGGRHTMRARVEVA
jgi:glucose-6-phosphate 1-epimerase